MDSKQQINYQKLLKSLLTTCHLKSMTFELQSEIRSNQAPHSTP